MLQVKESLFKGRIRSIDAFRGITIFVMIFVNELSFVKNVPQWLKHMPAEADAMTFVDVVFPAFLFIVGMSIPFSFNARLRKDQPTKIIWKHTLKRTIALIVMGVYMVNTEYGYDESKMLINMATWAFIAYTLPIPVWNLYPKSFSKPLKITLQILGILGFVALYFLYVQDNGAIGITSKWWGILGLIGWAYLLSVLVYWFTNGHLYLQIAFLAICIACNCISQAKLGLASNEVFSFISGHMVHATLVIAGVIISLLFFDGNSNKRLNLPVIGFAVLFALLGFILRPYFEVSKIRGTPSWTLYSAAICTAFFYFLYWIIEVEKEWKWTEFFMPAASNPLLIYILPGIILFFNRMTGLQIVPDYFNEGTPGIIWSLMFSTIMLFVIRICNKAHIKLHL